MHSSGPGECTASGLRAREAGQDEPRLLADGPPRFDPPRSPAPPGWPSPSRAGLFETIALLATIQMLQGGSRKPGDFSFDPLNFSKGADAQRLAVSEVKNGRLAMLAFSGMITQAALSGNGFPFTYT